MRRGWGSKCPYGYVIGWHFYQGNSRVTKIVDFVCNHLISNLVKFIYSEKATKFLRNLHLFLTGTSASQKKVEISQNFCGLLRIHELYNIDLKAYAPTCIESFFSHVLYIWNSIAYKDSNSMMIGLTAVMKTLLTWNFVKLET